MKSEIVERWLASAVPAQIIRVYRAKQEAQATWAEYPDEDVLRAVRAALEVAVLAEVWRIYAGKDGCGG